ncbi:hypothetical protein LP414_09575 [Polaromonas sp. P1(28)-13]|nr:hypothetical protein LP414_09575 [Polaromonas sp. P1(28)-13]
MNTELETVDEALDTTLMTTMNVDAKGQTDHTASSRGSNVIQFPVKQAA